MIATLGTGIKHAGFLFKGAWLAVTVWMAGGVVAHARDVYQDRHAESIIADRVAREEASSAWQRVRAWFAESSKVIRIRAALLVVFYVVGLVLAVELSQASCLAGHTIGCRIAKSVIGGS